MSRRSVRTTRHSYPQDEINAMTRFYRGKRCVVASMEDGAEWCHMLDAALKPSNDRLEDMLLRHLREDRYPAHAAEVRENLVPLLSMHHSAINVRPPRGTLFLYEDIIARTLAYERDLHDWRIAELTAGRGDPGRPKYEDVFGGRVNTEHRWHAAPRFEGCNRLAPNGRSFNSFFQEDCPGIDNPSSQNPFPIIDTLLSIPFSLIHNLPRLVAIVPHSAYQHQLVIMGLEIMMWWWWDPSPDEIKKYEGITNQHDGARSAQPHPIHHPSRSGTKFSPIFIPPTWLAPAPPPSNSMSTSVPPASATSPENPPSNLFEPYVPHGTQITRPFNQDLRTFELPSGQILLGTTPSFSRDGDELLLTVEDEGLAEMGVVHADKGIATGGMNLPVTYESWDIQSIEGTEMSDDIDAMEDVDEQPPTGFSSPDILSWNAQVAESAPEPLPLIPGSFERGVIGGMSTNDVLMIKGLIDPRQYIRFFDLSVFSCRSAHVS